METITIKENWKAPFASSSYLTTFKQLLRFFFWGGLIIGLVFFVISFDTSSVFDWLKKGGLLLVCCMLGGPATLIVFFIFIIPIILLFQIPKMISPNTYEFGLGEGRFMMKKNNRTKVDVPLSDYIGCTFVTVTVNKMGGNDLGNLLRIEFLKTGKEATKEINLGYIPDDDKIQLRHFMMLVEAQK